MQADAALTLEALLERLQDVAIGDSSQAGWPEGRGVGTLGAAAVVGPLGAAELAGVRRQIAEELDSELAPWRTLHLALAEVLDASAIVAGDAAMACYFGTAHLLLLEGPSQWLYPTGFCTLGYGFPAAIGAKLAHPDRQVLAIMGDGGVMFTLSELATAAELRLGIPLVVVNNGGYGEIRREMVAMGFEPVGTDFKSPDFATVARGLGAAGLRTTPAHVGQAVKEAFARDRPTLIEIEAG